MGKGKTPILILLLVVAVGALAYVLTREEETPPAPEPTTSAPPVEVPDTTTAAPPADTPEPDAAAAAPPFGSPTDTADASAVWAYLTDNQLAGPGATVSNAYPGEMPHGQLLETVTQDADIAGHGGTLIIKRNFAAPEGETITAEQVTADPDAYLTAVTIMFQREAGYDDDHANWFWAKYLPDGSLDKNPAGMELAGRVGNVEADAGCLGCHANAPGEDFVFTN